MRYLIVISASTMTDNDNISTFSDASAYTSTWNFETPPIRQRRLLRSTKSTTSTDTGDTIDNWYYVVIL